MTATLPLRFGQAVIAAVVLPATILSANPNSQGHPTVPTTERALLARALLQSPRIKLLDYHVSGNRDEATAKHNLTQTARDLPAKRSYYGEAPGGATRLSVEMLRALYILAREGYSFRITELAGGSHCSTSRHYSGVAFDIDVLNGRKIAPGHPSYRRFLRRCRELGATEVFGPGAHGHSSHLHISWPRPESELAQDEN